MRVRSMLFVLLAGIFLLNRSNSQQTPCPPMSTAQIVRDVVVQGASLNDLYGNWAQCGMDGQVFRGVHRSLDPHSSTSIMRISPDGSTLLFTLPDHVYAWVIAPAGTGLNILSGNYLITDQRFHFQMYHFDSRANLLAKNQGTIPIRPYAMTILPSGTTIVAGIHSNDPYDHETSKNGFAILDENDQLVRSVDLPLPSGGGGWTFASPQMAAGDGVAYIMLHSNAPAQTAIATISEKRNQILNIKVIAAPPDTETRHHNEWVFGPGVVVDVYLYTNERPHVTDHFDEYDLHTGQKIVTRSAPPTGFQFGCYMKDGVSMLAHSAHTDPARHLSPDTLRLVTSKLQ